MEILANTRENVGNTDLWVFLENNKIYRTYDAQKKGQLIFVQKKPFFGRAVEGLFLSKAGPHRG